MTIIPSKPLKPCNKQGCNTLTRERYCDEHKELAEQIKHQSNKHYNKYVRDPITTAFYKSKAWILVRQLALVRDHGLCVLCFKDNKITMADMVDHIIPVKEAWNLRLTLSNLQSLCNACHNRKTAEDEKQCGEGPLKKF